MLLLESLAQEQGCCWEVYMTTSYFATSQVYLFHGPSESVHGCYLEAADLAKKKGVDVPRRNKGGEASYK